MKLLYAVLEGIGSTVLLAVRSAKYINTLPRQFPRFIEQCYLIGYTTMPIVTILCFFIGSVLALQTGYSMAETSAPSSSSARSSALPWCANSVR